MTSHSLWRTLALGLSIASVLSGCGAGFSNGSTLKGTVAVGAPVPGALVKVVDSMGNVRTATSGDDGTYSVSTQGLVSPYVITAVGAIGTQEVSLSSVVTSTDASKAIANVTPLTTAITALVAGTSGSYEPGAVQPASLDASKVNIAKSNLSQALGSLLSQVGLTAFDPVTSSFVANKIGADEVLDAVDVRLRSYGVVLSNRLQPLGTDLDPAAAVISQGGQSGGLASGEAIGSILADFEARVKACFALPAAQRATLSVDVGGYKTATNLHDSCSGLVYPGEGGYLGQSYTFGEYWGAWLTDSAFDGATVNVAIRYVVDSSSCTSNCLEPYKTSGGGKSYVVNFNLKDNTGQWYTRPDVLIKPTADSKFYLAGNRRPVEFSVQPGFTMIDDQSTPANSRVEGRYVFFVTPNRAQLTGDLAPKFHYDASAVDNNNKTCGATRSDACKKPMPKLVCAWVTGPFLQRTQQQGTQQHNTAAPRGGVLLKIPHPDAVNIQNYMGMQAKYSADFDPIGTPAHQAILYSDCISQTGGAVATPSTTNFYTVMAAPTVGATWAYNPSATTGPDVTGTNLGVCDSTSCPRRSYVNYRPQPVSASEAAWYESLAGATSMARFTAIFFKADGFGIGTSSDPWGNAANFWSNRIELPAPVRMVGAMPFIPTSGGYYDGGVKFRKINQAALDDILGTSTGFPIFDPASNTGVVNLSWTVPEGAQGVDRIGGLNRAYFYDSTKLVHPIIVPSIAQISTPVSRSRQDGSLNLTDAWFNQTMLGKTASSSPAVPASWVSPTAAPNTRTGYLPQGSVAVSRVYREVWTRSYDTENRQIQYVASRTLSSP